MSSEPSWVSVAVAPSSVDRQIDEMVDDPAGYFVRARRRAESEARGYVSRRVSTGASRRGRSAPAERPARPARIA